MNAADRELIEAVVARTGMDRWRLLLDPVSPAYQPGYRATALAILGRDVQSPTAPKPAAYPPLRTQLASAVRAGGRVVATVARGQRPTVDLDEQARRLAICHGCEHHDPSQGRCRKCGCLGALKTRIATESCPDNPPRW